MSYVEAEAAIVLFSPRSRPVLVDKQITFNARRKGSLGVAE